MTTDLARAAAVIEALSAAWTVFNLYPDPTSQPAFRRVTALLRESLADEEVALEIGPQGFLIGEEEVVVGREAADRLVKRCFVHHVEVLAVSGRPSDRDIVKFLGVIAQEEQDLAASGGVSSALTKEGVSCFTVVARSLLDTADEEDTVERDTRVEAVMSAGGDPEEFARALLEEAGHDAEALGDLFHNRYRDVFDQVDEEDVTGREEVVKAFVEAFFFFEESPQVAVLERFLGGQDDWIDRVFLDQFAGHELARFAPRLDSRGFSLLLDYARIATDHTDKRPAELLGLLESPEPVRTARELVAVRMQERLSEFDTAGTQQEAFASLREQFPDSRRYFYETLETFRALLAAEERDDRFRRLMRVLTGKIGVSIRRGQCRRAELWLRAVLDRPTFPPERAAEVDDAVEQAASPDVLELLVSEVARAEDSVAAQRLLTRLAASRVDALIDMMGEEEDRAKRKVLLDVLGKEATRDPAVIVGRLDDHRWFVVRNLALVLGHTADTSILPALAGLLDHEDHRVRVEALRAINTVDGDGVQHMARALSDRHEQVRLTAVALLAARKTGEADSLLIEALWGTGLDTAEKERIIGVLGARETRDARDALESLARKRFLFSAKARQLRNSAREAL